MKETILKVIDKLGIKATVDEFDKSFQIIGKTLEVSILYDELKNRGLSVEKSKMYLGTIYINK